MNIYFSDLNKDAQARLMKEAGIGDPKEANWDVDIVPLAEVNVSGLEPDEGYGICD